MDHRSLYRRRQARAIAISELVDEGRRAAMARITLALAAMAVVVEAVMVAHHAWGFTAP